MKSLTTLLFLFTLSIGFTQNTRTIGFYNVENLFDTINGINDDAEFLPEAKNNWNSEKYLEKLNHINQVFDQFQSPLLIGLCEIENIDVIRAINANSTTRKNFGVVHFESTDERGIDVGFIYDSLSLKLVDSGFLRFELDNPDHSKTRDIVWAKFQYKKETFYAMVNHWPSRRGGTDDSEKNRVLAAQTARIFIDSLLEKNSKEQIVFMGDLNDYPTDKAPQLIQEKLTPMITKESGTYGGSHNYNNEWNVLDHMFVSDGFLGKKGIKVVKNSGKINSYDFLLTEYKGNTVPFRTYGGSKYLKGYSDHLPVTIEVCFP